MTNVKFTTVLKEVFENAARTKNDLSRLHSALADIGLPRLICGETSHDTMNGLNAFARGEPEGELKAMAQSLAADLKNEKFLKPGF